MPRTRLPVTGLALVAALGLGACGTASDPSPPTGVDQLTIPTPSPDPADFVAGVDNPWFRLAPAATWRYQVIGATDATERVVTVAPGPEIAGVPTTARVSREDGEVTRDFYAQDAEGNVWWFGREGEWEAGRDGAQAGLAVPAHPRVGDGFRTAYLPGVVEDVATVTALDGSATVPAGSYDDLVVLETASPSTPLVRHTLALARGTGPVEEEVSGETARLEAVSATD